jgi:hypothetical protein
MRMVDLPAAMISHHVTEAYRRGMLDIHPRHIVLTTIHAQHADLSPIFSG